MKCHGDFFVKLKQRLVLLVQYEKVLRQGGTPSVATLLSGATPVVIRLLIGTMRAHIHMHRLRPDTPGSMLPSVFGDCVCVCVCAEQVSQHKDIFLISWFLNIKH